MKSNNSGRGLAVMLLVPMGLLFCATPVRLWGAYSALLLFVLVFPANINMAIQWSGRPMPAPLFAYLRLRLQLALFYWAFAISKVIKETKISKVPTIVDVTKPRN